MMKRYLVEFIAFLPKVSGCKPLLPIFSLPDYSNASGRERLTMKLDFPTRISNQADKLKKGESSKGWSSALGGL
jgi:hypothetical protein